MAATRHLVLRVDDIMAFQLPLLDCQVAL